MELPQLFWDYPRNGFDAIADIAEAYAATLKPPASSILREFAVALRDPSSIDAKLLDRAHAVQLGFEYSMARVAQLIRLVRAVHLTGDYTPGTKSTLLYVAKAIADHIGTTKVLTLEAPHRYRDLAAADRPDIQSAFEACWIAGEYQAAIHLLKEMGVLSRPWR